MLTHGAMIRGMETRDVSTRGMETRGVSTLCEDFHSNHRGDNLLPHVKGKTDLLG